VVAVVAAAVAVAVAAVAAVTVAALQRKRWPQRQVSALQCRR
jgi:hypothetical protein